MDEWVRIRSDRLTAAINPLGAELSSLTDRDGRELMTDADPAFWTGRAPLLFPIIGRLEGDRLRRGACTAIMEKHGFARRMAFTLVEASDSTARFRLTDSDATRAIYPFAFALDMAFLLDGPTLAMAATVTNTGDTDLPFSFGFHPAFAWPLPGSGDRADHQILFETEEPDALARVTPYGTIAPDPVPSPVSGRVLALHDGLFADDALVWRAVRSRRLHYGAPGHPGLDIRFPDTPMLGIWTKPGARFLCVEPWAGHADPEGFAGDFRDKPGIMTLAPGDARTFRMDVTHTA